MATKPDVTATDRELNAEKMRFNELYGLLEADLAALGMGKDTVDDIISHADLYGVAYTEERLASEPSYFELPKDASPAALAKAAARIKDLYDSNKAMDRLLKGREDILCAWDPNRQRVVQLFGREVAVDLEAKTMRYADNGKVVPISVETVHVREMDDERKR